MIQNDHLVEFEKEPADRRAIVALFGYLDIPFMLIFLVLGYINGNFRNWMAFESMWKVYAIVVGIPFVAWLLYLNLFKSGWFIRVSFYTIAIVVYIHALAENDFAVARGKWISISQLIISIAIVATSFNKQVLYRLRVGIRTIIPYLFIVLLGLLAFFL